MDFSKFDKEIEKNALYNAINYNGKSNPNAVLSKIIPLVLKETKIDDKKQIIADLKKYISKKVNEINALYLEEQKKLLKTKFSDFEKSKKQQKEKGGIHELPKLEGEDIIMRFAPSPSGPLHLGHSYVLSLNSELTKKHKGRLIIRIEDTNSSNIYPKAYEMIPEDANWLTKNNIHKVIIQSERLEIYYKYAEELLKKGHAYICNCKPEEFKKLLDKKQACPCRNLHIKEQLNRWKKMFGEYKQGEAVMRIKTDIQHKNPAMRDWAAFRINDDNHPKTATKYRVWPLMNFSVAIDDHELNITHSIRAKDHMDNEKKQKYIFDYFGWKPPKHLYVGRINFIDMEMSSSKMRKDIGEGIYFGWDDPRLPTLRALKKRGYLPDTFVKYALSVGLTQNDKTVTKDEFYKNLNHINKELIDKTSKRFFFIKDAVELKILNYNGKQIELKMHPDYDLGKRKFITTNKFYVRNKDYEEMNKNNKIHRLMDLLNFKFDENKSAHFISYGHEEFKNSKEKGRIIDWLPADEEQVIGVEIYMPDGSIIEGITEKNIKDLKIGEVIQFERFGFCRLDEKKEKKVIFYFGHK